jgi:tetratricopeptide (TPR) repeat protein
VTGLRPALSYDRDEFHFELGTLLVRTNSYGEALAELRAVKKVAPDARYRYFYNMAYAEYRLGQIAAAREHIAKAREYARTPEEKVSTDRLEQALESLPPAAEFPVAVGVGLLAHGGGPARFNRDSECAERLPLPLPGLLPRSRPGVPVAALWQSPEFGRSRLLPCGHRKTLGQEEAGWAAARKKAAPRP